MRNKICGRERREIAKKGNDKMNIWKNKEINKGDEKRSIFFFTEQVTAQGH